MEEIFIGQDDWNHAVIVLAKGDKVGINTIGGKLCILGPDETAKLIEALSQHIAKLA